MLAATGWEVWKAFGQRAGVRPVLQRGTCDQVWAC